MFEPVIAPSGTLLGLLQRGRGDGTLHALAAPRAEALAALDHCVLNDPRRDWQVENRSLYYARLYLDLHGGLEAVEEHLFGPDDHVDTEESRTGLALAVLGHLAAYGRLDALLLLRRYVTTGANWAWALDELALRDDDAALRRLADPVLARFPATPRATPPWPPPCATPTSPGRGGCGPTTRAKPSAPGCAPRASRAPSTAGSARCAPPGRVPAGASRPCSTGPSRAWRSAVRCCTRPPPAASPRSRDPTTGPSSWRPPAAAPTAPAAPPSTTSPRRATRPYST